MNVCSCEVQKRVEYGAFKIKGNMFTSAKIFGVDCCVDRKSSSYQRHPKYYSIYDKIKMCYDTNPTDFVSMFQGA